eukprot:m.245506 g.245506  ORF g.245506 m.245506 type:complete len:906 (-) comp26406_c0_seq1:1765-4482(-)
MPNLAEAYETLPIQRSPRERDFPTKKEGRPSDASDDSDLTIMCGSNVQSPSSPAVSNGAIGFALDDRGLEELLHKSPECYAVVVWDYLAANEDELTLRKGESVAIHCRDESVIGDVGWWYGKVGSRAGVFPLNYVKAVVLPNEPHATDRPSLFEIDASELTKHKLLATGGFGRVFLGSYNHKVVAIKELICTAVSDDQLASKCEDLRLEGELLAQFSHRNIATLYGAVTTMPSVALVMEYASGGSVFTALEAVFLSPEEVLDWAVQIARGMNYLHNESPVSVVHRDLKSANVLLANAGVDSEVQTLGNVLKITDFGLARKFVGSLNESGSFGTCQWMAPETIRNGTFSKSSDVWSFGVVLWELLTSQVPYRGLPWGTVVYSVGVGGSALPIPSSCPEPFRDLLVKCAEKEPTSRPGFGRIVTILQDIRGRVGGDRPTGGAAWKAMQVHWKAEMEGRFLSLKQSEKVMESQQVELRTIQQRQTQRQKALNDMESSLIQRSRELQYRELKLLVDAGREPMAARPAPVRRRGHRQRHHKTGGHSIRISKEDIGTPKEFRHLVHLTNDGGLERLSGKVKSPVFASARPLRYDGVQCRNCFHVSMTIGETKCALCHLALPRTSTASSGLGSPVAFACDMSDTNIWQPESVAKSEPESVDSDTSPTSRRRWMLGLRRGVTSPPSFGRPRRTTTDSGVIMRRVGSPDAPTSPLLSGIHADTLGEQPRRAQSALQGSKRRLAARTVSENTSDAVQPRLPYSPEGSGPQSPWGDSTCFEWYKPTLTRSATKTFLLGKQHGTFLVRKSQSQPGSLAISVLQRDGEIWNGLMIPSDDGWRLGMSGPIHFVNPTELVKYYCQVPYARDTVGQNCTLHLPGLTDAGPARLRAMSESLLKINPLGTARGRPIEDLSQQL